MLTAEHAPAVLGQIENSPSFAGMSFALQNLNGPWNQTVKLTGENGDYLRDGSGRVLYEYRLADQVSNLRAGVSKEATVAVNNDSSLKQVRWSVRNGVPNINISPKKDAAFEPRSTASGYKYQLQDPGPNYGISAEVLSFTEDFNLTIRLTNNYIRHCSVFVSFLGGDGKTAIIVPDNIWTQLVEDAISAVLKEWNTLTGSDVEFIFDKTNRLKFLAPTVAAIASTVYDIVENPDMAGKDLVNLFVSLSNSVVQKILAASDVAAKLAAYFGAEEAAEAVPIVGWALKAEVIEATIEQLAQTVGEVIGSERVVEFDITITMGVEITLLASGKEGFPATATSYTITAQYSDVTGYVYTADLKDPKAKSFSVTWDNMPVGGKVTFLVAFYSKEGWLVGKGQSAKVDNRITEGKGVLVVPPITITELLYPLTDKTTYNHQQILEYTGGAHVWVESPNAPSETAKDLGTGEGGHVLDALTGISLNSDLGIGGYSWQASGQNVPQIGTSEPLDLPVYTFQNISFGPSPESALMFVPAGYCSSPQLVYLRSAAGESEAAGRSFFFLDPVADSVSSYHLRGITPVTDPSIPPESPERLFDLSTAMSWGRFRLLPTSMAIHSNGVVVAVSRGYSKLQILNLPQAAVPSENAPWSQVLSGPGTREGLLGLPELVAIAPDQTVFVLETGNSRIQAFSRGGHPVPAFPKLPTPYWIPLFKEPGESSTITYASMSVEVKGYIYVLSYENDGYKAEEFRLDIYTPEGGHLLRQRGVNVAAMTVDLWRNLYTLDYRAILGPGSRTEPSVSEWVPSTPKNS